MKYIKAICCILIICLSFSGCSFNIASSIDDLISPIAPFGENANVQNAMDHYVDGPYSLKTPAYGDYATSYVFYDVDSDGVEEAFCFYEPSDDLGNVYMAVLKKTDNKWTVTNSLKGNGKDVYSIDFSDINGDTNYEIIVCWDDISNSLSHNLTIFKYSNVDGQVDISRVEDSIIANNYLCVDFDNDGKQEIIVLLNDASKSVASKGQLYSIDNGKFNLLGETKLDGHISSYTNICSDNYDGRVRIFADAINSTGDSMLTEIIFWSDRYNNIISPFYSYSTGFTKDTSRNAMVDSMDIDNDGIIELPQDVNLDSLPENINLVDWKKYKNTVLVHNSYSILVKDDNYLVVVPDELFNSINVSYNNDDRTLTVSDKSSNTMIYSITSVLKSLYDKDSYADYELIMDNSGYYYLAKFGENSVINTQTLKDMVKSC